MVGLQPDDKPRDDGTLPRRRSSGRPVMQGKAPKSLRDKIPIGPIARTLPTYAGPYSVGIMEIEVPVESSRSFACESDAYRDFLQLETVLMCVFYPSALGTGVGDDGSGQKGWSRQTWLPRPRREIAAGYAKFASVPEWLGELWFAATAMPTKLPAFRNAPLAEHWPPDITAREAGSKVKNQKGKPPPGFAENELPKFPLMIFSHGLGGTRTAYSHVCGEFASFGFIVCALEHRDGSAPRTFIHRQPDDREGDSELDDKKEAKEQSPRHIDYIFPKDNPFDTSPTNDKGIDRHLRDSQLQMRKAEVYEAYHVMTMIQQGKGDIIAKQNLRRKGYIGSSSRGLDGIDWPKWKDRFHLQQVTMVGHSFGAATTVEVLRERERDFKFVTQGIIYDIWGGPIRPPVNPQSRITCPLLGINSEAFMYWETNFSKAMSLVRESAWGQTSLTHPSTSSSSCCIPDDSATTLSPTFPSSAAQTPTHITYLLTVKGTVHISQSDFPLLYPHLIPSLLHTTISPHLAIELNIRASLEFLQLVLPSRISAVEQASKSAGLLDHSDDIELLVPKDFADLKGKPRKKEHLAVTLHKGGFWENWRRKGRRCLGKSWSWKAMGHKRRRRSTLDVGKGHVWMHFAPGRENRKDDDDDDDDHGDGDDGVEVEEEEEVQEKEQKGDEQMKTQ